MEFSIKSIEKAWKKSGGICEQCSKRLVYLSMDKSDQRGAWNPWDRSGLNGLGPDTAENCEILCYQCYLRARYKTALKNRI
ncbi:MAG: hypothetical protein M0R46_01095 [Candidatus Muirbacterium halophilum]|nr:hypothetical protein [Candidatus Muirbacterium halophilum]MCK9474491.1 hypothetical protein [Candidatus Muirbacterium halophilum]